MSREQVLISPQKGAQEQFVNLPTDINIVFYGGSAGGGKSFALLMDALKYVDCPHFYAVFFRRTTQQLERALWPEAKAMYIPFITDENGKFIGKAKIQEKSHKITFPSGAILEFTYMDLDQSAQLNFQGAEISGCYWDELTHFSQYQFNYLRTRLRSKSKYPSFMRASMNPDNTHFVKLYITAFLDEDGYPIKELSGKIRYFIIDNGDVVTHWEEAWFKEHYPKRKPRSYTFVPSKLSDNPKMLANNPDYAEDLASNSRLEKETLLDGCWNVTLQEAAYFQRSWVKNKKPPLGAISARGYDKAASPVSEVNKKPDYTASVRMFRDREGFFYMSGGYHPRFCDEDSDVYGKFRKRAGERDTIIALQATLDGSQTPIVLTQDPGGAGKVEYEESAKKLIAQGFTVKKDPVAITKSKLTKFQPFASACENGLVFIDEESFGNKPTLEAFYRELESFTGERSTAERHDDVADAAATTFNYLSRQTIIHNIPFTGGSSDIKKAILSR